MNRMTDAMTEKEHELLGEVLLISSQRALKIERLEAEIERLRTTIYEWKPATDVVDKLKGPHEWGYRDALDGKFIEDPTPFYAAAEIERLSALLSASPSPDGKP